MERRHDPIHRPARPALSGDVLARVVEQLAGNETIAERLRSAGFTDVHVTGEGRTRIAQALWPKDDATAAMPAQVSAVAEIEEA